MCACVYVKKEEKDLKIPLTNCLFRDILYGRKDYSYLEVPVMVAKFGKCADNMTKEEMSLWLRNIENKPLKKAMLEIIDFYDCARIDEKMLIEDCLGSIGFLKETFCAVAEEESVREEKDQ